MFTCVLFQMEKKHCVWCIHCVFVKFSSYRNNGLSTCVRLEPLFLYFKFCSTVVSICVHPLYPPFLEFYKKKIALNERIFFYIEITCALVTLCINYVLANHKITNAINQEPNWNQTIPTPFTTWNKADVKTCSSQIDFV